MSDRNDVQALVVGIGATGMSSEWDLPKAPEHAVRFVEWLRQNQVAPANIHLFLSKKHHEVFKARLSKAGVTPRPATQDAIISFLQNDLTQLNAPLLYIYWSGHGNIGDAEQRILFCEDWQDKQHDRHLDLHNFLQWLKRSDTGRHCPLQVAWIDACANEFEELGFSSNTGARRLSLEKAAIPGVAQSFYLAAAPGQQAQAGKFSEFVLDALRTSPSFPPDPEAVLKAVLPNFQDSYQTPIRISYRHKGSEGEYETSFGDLPSSRFVNSVSELRKVPVRHIRRLADIAASYDGLVAAEARDSVYRYLAESAGKPVTNRVARPNVSADLAHILASGWYWNSEAQLVPAVLRLVPDAAEFQVEFRRARLIGDVIDGLSQLAKPVEFLRRMYRAVIATQSEEPARENARTLVDMLDELTAAASVEEDRYQPLFEFLLRVDAAVPAAQGQALRTIVDQEASAALLDSVKARLEAEKQFRLQIRIDSDDDANDRPSKVQAMLFVANTARHVQRWEFDVSSWQTEVETRVREIVKEARAKVSSQSAGSIVVEFILSPPLLTRAPHRIPLIERKYLKRAIGQMNPTVIRASEILDAIRERTTWKRVKDLRSKPPEVRWIQSAGKDCPEDASLLALAFCPEGDEGVEQLVRVIALGHPFIAWPEKLPADWDSYRASFDKWARGLDETDRIPIALRSVREKGDPPEFGNDLVLFWDDPDSPTDFRRTDVTMAGS